MSNWKALKGSIDVERLEEGLGISVASRNGHEDICHCPLPSHVGEDKNPSFSINREKKLFNCFTCGVGGTLITLVMEIKKCSYEDAYNYCRTYSNLQSGSGQELLEKLQKIINASSSDKIVYSRSLPVFKKDILNRWEEKTDYYSSRGISDETVELLQLKYDPEHSRGTYTGPAAIIPHFWNGQLVGYQERWLGENTPKNLPKYTNTKDFPKSETLYNYDSIKNDKDVGGNIIVVESVLTVAYLVSNGYKAIATFGASVSKDQIYFIKNLCAVGYKVYISFDNDAAGDAATDRVVKQLRHSIPLFIVPKPDKEKGDLNDLTPEDIAARISSARPWWASKRT